jgi:hypothetical protein
MREGLELPITAAAGSEPALFPIGRLDVIYGFKPYYNVRLCSYPLKRLLNQIEISSIPFVSILCNYQWLLFTMT